MRRAGLAALLAAAGCGAALAEEPSPLHTFADAFFAVDFPADPKVTKGTYPAITPTGGEVPVPAETYALDQPGAHFSVTVAHLAGTPAQGPHALDDAVAAFRARHPDLPLDTVVSHSLDGSKMQLCGRNFGFNGADGALHYQSLYYNPNTALFYDVGSTVAADALAQHGGDAEHFQVSFNLIADARSQLPAPPEWPANWALHSYPDLGFGIRFPAEPTVAEGTYTTAGGVTVPATRYAVQVGDTLYRLTVVRPYGTAADPEGASAEAAVIDAVTLWKRQGAVLADDAVAIGAGQCGRDVTVRKADGRTARASIFFPATQQKVYIVEVAQVAPGPAPDPLDDRRFRESLSLVLAQ